MKDITVQELDKKIENKEDFFLLDVREQMEYDMFNLNGKLIPLGELSNHFTELEAYKNQEVIVHCRSGKRSGVAKELLIRQGFSNVKNLLGGVLAWIDMKNS